MWPFSWFATRRWERQQRAKVLARPGTFFVAAGGLTLWIYGEYLHAIDDNLIWARCYSNIYPGGEEGSFPVKRIMFPLTEEQFAVARRNNWESHD